MPINIVKSRIPSANGGWQCYDPVTATVGDRLYNRQEKVHREVDRLHGRELHSRQSGPNTTL